MVKTKTLYQCQQCGAEYPKWAGQCIDCGAWNSLTEVVATKSKRGGYAGESIKKPAQKLSEVPVTSETRFSTSLEEFDRVLGGGLVCGSVVLIGGDPGIGKSTLLIEATANLAQKIPALYVTGEESLQQVRIRAERLQLPADNIKALAETQVERIIELALEEKPQVMVIDSIQTMFSDTVSSAPGSVSQIRESAQQFVRFAKQTNTSIVFVGHVTKEGALAGPRVLEHMVDTVLYFEGQSDGRFRALRAIKNRFGAVNELGIFAMTDKGLKQVANPSAIFLSGAEQTHRPGSTVMVSWEGSRPLLVEIQALADEAQGGHPRRITIGFDHNRLVMLLAVMHRHGGVFTFDRDVFLNAVGGVRITETGSDLACLLAILSSLKDRTIPLDTIVMGEVGLAGEIRPVPNGQERLKEALKHGFKKAIVPFANKPKKAVPGMKVQAVKTLREAIDAVEWS